MEKNVIARSAATRQSHKFKSISQAHLSNIRSKDEEIYIIDQWKMERI